jgi:hypothetical protein
MSTNLIKDANFNKVAGSVKPDAKKRILLSKIAVPEGVTYHIYANSLGQIVLDPQITIPASEAWLWQNPSALVSVQRGLNEAAQGKVTEIDLDEL